MAASKVPQIRGAKDAHLAIDDTLSLAPRTSRPQSITVVGAGILGLWQALILQRAGHRVRLVEQSATPFTASASRFAGAMLAPGCESENTPEVRELGPRGLVLWRTVYPRLINAGSLIVAAPRDAAEATRFARATRPPQTLDAAQLGDLEPDLAGRFQSAFYFPDEAHMATPDALDFLLGAIGDAGAVIELGSSWTGPAGDELVVDCRGMAAASEIPALRGVRGERLLVATPEIHLSRPVRLLHPRHPLYVVPWGDGRFLVGATVIESDDAGPITVRSALELLGAAYALHPAFAEAQILDAGAGVRPSLPNNLPRIEVRAGGRHILVNGAYRNGFLLAPVLAEAVAAYLANQSPHPLLVSERTLAHDHHPG